MSRLTTIRLHLWLETGDGMVFGLGRVHLLDMIERLGSLRKAAGALGMSYRAAWCKLRASEQALDAPLVETLAHKRDGCRLTTQGAFMRDAFRQWFGSVERCAFLSAENCFPWPVTPYPGDDAALASEVQPPEPAPWPTAVARL